jgi:hypothetical protein
MANRNYSWISCLPKGVLLSPTSNENPFGNFGALTGVLGVTMASTPLFQIVSSSPAKNLRIFSAAIISNAVVEEPKRKKKKKKC